jgi:hypothetical protein
MSNSFELDLDITVQLRAAAIRGSSRRTEAPTEMSPKNAVQPAIERANPNIEQMENRL